MAEQRTSNLGFHLPAPTNAAPLVLAYEHDTHGHVIAERDSGTRFAYWHLMDVDNAGRFQENPYN